MPFSIGVLSPSSVMRIMWLPVKLTKLLLILMGIWSDPNDWSPCSRLIQPNWISGLLSSSWIWFLKWGRLLSSICFCKLAPLSFLLFVLFLNSAKNPSELKWMGIRGWCWRRLGHCPEEVVRMKVDGSTGSGCSGAVSRTHCLCQ